MLEYLEKSGTPKRHATISNREFGPAYRVLLAIFVVDSIVTCIGNILTILVVYKDPSLKTMGNMHIVSLAVSDLIAGITGVFRVIWFINEDIDSIFSTNKTLCLVWYSLFFSSFAASLLSMLLIAVDRWLYIARPLQYYNWITPNITAMMIALAWTTAIAFGLLPISINSFDSIGVCVNRAVTPPLFYACGIGIILFGTCTVSFALYFQIFMIAKKQKNITLALTRVNSKHRHSFRETKILFVICYITFFCWIPFYIENFPGMPPISYEFSNFILSLCLFNSCVNFFLYAANQTRFRNSFFKLLPCNKNKVSGPPSETTSIATLHGN